jgi:hypothetical protein
MITPRGLGYKTPNPNAKGVTRRQKLLKKPKSNAKKYVSELQTLKIQN